MISRQTCGPLLATAFALLSDPARADALTAALGTRQSLNVTAIIMFLGFVAVSLGVTFWAARQGTSTAKDFYAAGGDLKDSRTGSRSPATTLRPRLSWGLPRSSTPRAMTA